MVLRTIAVVMAVLCLIVYWPRSGSGIEGARLLSAAELRELPAGPAGDRLLGHHLGCRVFGHDGCSSWKNLPEPAYHVWASLAFESQTANGLKFYLLAVGTHTDGPTRAEVIAAYQAMGDSASAATIHALGQLGAESSADAVAALEQRLTAALAHAREIRRAYVAEHADIIASER